MMVMQLQTGRDVLRTHFPWQLMMKHSMWMAFQHRREMQGFDEREQRDEVLLNAAAVSTSDGEEGQSSDEALKAGGAGSDSESDGGWLESGGCASTVAGAVAPAAAVATRSRPLQ